MVARILDAGEATLIAHGYDGASTNRIAAAAGISPGSLYQYFPHKDAVIAAVIDRYSDAVASRVAGKLADQLGQPATVAARTTLATLLDALDVHPQFLRAVVEQVPRLDFAGKLSAFEQRIGDMITAYLMLHRDTVRADMPLDAGAWILVRTVEHLTVRYILDRPPIPRERFLDELTRLALNYLGPAR
ncbi:MAG TPA: TetR/AcrR family transcriptional regulator [Rugosimonospora sp.]|nr:TetR/AcrR family transcriptional regulator [Rugosimonospora sp.]